MGKGLCWKCWTKHCEIDDKRGLPEARKYVGVYAIAKDGDEE